MDCRLAEPAFRITPMFVSDKYLRPIFCRELQMARRLLLRPAVNGSEGPDQTETDPQENEVCDGCSSPAGCDRCRDDASSPGRQGGLVTRVVRDAGRATSCESPE